MATLIGPHAAVDLALPTGVDGSTVLQFMLRSGISAEEHVRRVAAAIGAVNQEIFNTFAGLLYMTDSLYAYTSQGVGERGKTPVKAEFAKPDAVRTSGIGSMLPLSDYEDALAWTAIYMRDAPAAQLVGDQKLIADRWWNRFGFNLWTRILTKEENAIGSGYDVPWAVGSGNNVNYIPPQYRGFDALTSSHTHFLYYDTGSYDWHHAFNGMIQELVHHGHRSPHTIYVSYDDIDDIEAVEGFVELKPENWQRIPTFTVNAVAAASAPAVRTAPGLVEGVPGELFGFYKSNYGYAELRWNEYIPTHFGFATKSYGRDNPANGVAVRYHPAYGGFGLRVDPRITNSLSPELEAIYFPATFGVGINDRTNGVCAYVASGASSYPAAGSITIG